VFMEDLQAAREAMEQKTQRKRELINTLKGMNAKLMELREELNKHAPAPVPARRTPTQRLQEQAEHMEFVIATSAYTPAQERAMLKELKAVQAKIGTAAVEQKASDQVRELRGKLRAQLEERAVVQKELDALRSELEAIYQVILKAGAERAQAYAKREEYKARQGQREDRGERRSSEGGRGPRRFGNDDRRSFAESKRKAREEERAEMAPYMKEVDPFVSLEEIAEIKKKPAPPAE
ncbi:MAG: hypothetical protein KGH63_04305, partial [Candidatus Micrarchaeota archaeon]|nr:hypothetical protein [Candidatus Micrarchaeota archaeon]